MVTPVGRQVRQRRLYGNLALYKKVETDRDDQGKDPGNEVERRLYGNQA